MRSLQEAFGKVVAAILLSVFFPGVAGSQTGTLVHDGLTRTYSVYIPPDQHGPATLPLVIVLHGGGGDGKGMIRLTHNGFERLADRDGFIVAYPDGIEKGWNDGRRNSEFNDGRDRESVDDVGFLSALIDRMITEYSADPARIYVTGISNGAMMSYRLACELPGKIAAIAPVAGDITVSLSSVCKPAGPISVLIINGTNDPLVPYEGGEIGSKYRRIRRGKILSVEESVKYWVLNNNCSLVPATEKVYDSDHDDRTETTISRYPDGAEGTEVVLYSIKGGGHTWPGGFQYLPVWLVGRTSRDFDANEVIWDFFRKHPKQPQALQAP